MAASYQSHTAAQLIGLQPVFVDHKADWLQPIAVRAGEATRTIEKEGDRAAYEELL
jgi:hypothetical protein